MTRRWIRLAALAISCFALPIPVHGQDSSATWDDARTMQLVRRGIQHRMAGAADSTLQSYSAESHGYVYFLLDSPELDRQTLVRTDQVAVDVFWRAPDLLRQRIVGLRQRKELPVTRLYYYLDRLTLIQDNFGEGIVIADGDNVNHVPHPLAPDGEAIYQYRLVGSVTLRLPGVPDPVRVHEIQVRPRDTAAPGIVGSIFLEETRGALVRMNFTFTPASYVDPRLDFINVTLENGLWQGRYWLPYEQRLEIRREMPELDLPFGTLIRTRLRIGDYHFNESVPALLFSTSRPVTMAPADERESYPFEQPIDAEWRLEGIGQPMEVEELREEARSLVSERLMSGLPRNRPGFGSASDLFRYNRAEGPVVGAGWGFSPWPDASARVNGAWAFGAGHPALGVELHWHDDPALSLDGYVNRSSDVGGTQPSAGVTNTFAALLFGEDWLDPFYSSGIEATAEQSLTPGISLSGGARFERQRSAELTTSYSVFDDDGFRPVHPIDEGDLWAAGATLRRDPLAVAGDWSGEVTASVGRLAGLERDFTFGRAELRAGRFWTLSRARSQFDLTLEGGISVGDIPRQELYLLGGRGTLPGYEHRVFGGDAYFTSTARASADIAHPWVRGRLFAGIGWAGAGEPGEESLDAWGASPTDGLKPAMGAGVGLFYDLLRVDIARGFGDGSRTQVIIGIQTTFWDLL